MSAVFILFLRLAAHVSFNDILVFVVTASLGRGGEFCTPKHFLALLLAFDFFLQPFPRPVIHPCHLSTESLKVVKLI